MLAAACSKSIVLNPLGVPSQLGTAAARWSTAMAARPSWKSFLRLSLVSIPVKGYTAHATTSDVALHQIHSKCHNRIRYKKVCPVHGEVSKEEIVSGYEISKGKYVEIDPDELDKMRTANEKAINID